MSFALDGTVIEGLCGGLSTASQGICLYLAVFMQTLISVPC